MANQKTLLSELRSRSAVDCDTLDAEGMLHTKPRRLSNDLMLTSFFQLPRHWDLLLIVLRIRWVVQDTSSIPGF
jgi:hypothetical protein